MKKTSRRLIVGIAAVALAIALAGCRDIGVDIGIGGNEPSDPEPTDKLVQNYSINTELLSYLGKTPEGISALFGDYEESTWFTGMVFRYGELWFAFDGDSEYPTGELSFIACPATDLIDGLEAETDASSLGAFFGSEGIYDANAENGNEWYFGGFIAYRYDGYLIDFGCSEEMAISDDTTALIRSASTGSGAGYTLACVVPTAFDGIWEELSRPDDEGGQDFKTLSFSPAGTVEFNSGYYDAEFDSRQTYEVYEGTYEAFLAGDGGVGYNRVVFNLALDWWIAELDGADDGDIAYWEERQGIDGAYRISAEGGSLNLRLIEGKALSDTAWRGDPVEEHSFRLTP